MHPSRTARTTRTPRRTYAIARLTSQEILHMHIYKEHSRVGRRQAAAANRYQVGALHSRRHLQAPPQGRGGYLGLKLPVTGVHTIPQLPVAHLRTREEKKGLHKSVEVTRFDSTNDIHSCKESQQTAYLLVCLQRVPIQRHGSHTAQEHEKGEEGTTNRQQEERRALGKEKERVAASGKCSEWPHYRGAAHIYH
jgi:hypothetical protein